MLKDADVLPSRAVLFPWDGFIVYKLISGESIMIIIH